MNTKKFLFRFCLSVLLAAAIFSSAAAASGTVDPTFGVDGAVTTDLGSGADIGCGLLLQPDGKILALGFAYLNPNDPYEFTPIVTRHAANGTLDTAFGVNGMLFTDVSRYSKPKIALQPDGKFIVARTVLGSYTLTRYTSNGALDTTFGSGGTTALDLYGDTIETLADIIVQADGKIVAVGDHRLSGSNFTDFFIARFNPDGSPDTTFVANGIMILDKYNFPNNRYNYGKAVVVLPDGKIIITGNMMDDNGDTQVSLIRLTPDGYPDPTFGTNGLGSVMIPLPGFRHSSGAIALQADGKFIIAGTIYDEEQNISLDAVMLRFNSNGALDAAFGAAGMVVDDLGGNDSGADIRLQKDGKIVLVGTSTLDAVPTLVISRYNTNGSLDVEYGAGGRSFGAAGSSGAGVEIQPDGRILAVGSFNGDVLLTRYDIPVVTTSVVFKSTAAYDGSILEYAEFKNTGGTLDKFATTFNLGDDQRDRQYRAVLSFNTASLPDAAVVVGAQVKIKRQGLVGTDPFTTHGALTLNIANRAFSNNLALQLTDFAAAASAGSVQDAVLPEAAYWYVAALSPVNLGFVNKVGVTQFRLAFDKDDNDDLGADYLKFFSGNSVAANMPQFSVEYYLP